MSIRRTISLIVGLLMVLSTIPVTAARVECGMEMGDESSECRCCCQTTPGGNADDDACAAASPESVSCCQTEASESAPRSLPATRSASVELALTVAIPGANPLACPPSCGRSTSLDDIPDAIAAERQHSYLHVSSFLI